MTTSSWAQGARSLGELLAAAEGEGYGGQMVARPGARVHCFTCGDDHAAADLTVISLARVEGASDPGDEAVVAAITCPSCGTKGVLVLRYGPEASPEDAEVLNHFDRS